MRQAALICVFAAAAFAQVPDGLTVSVSRIVSVPPDEADFSVNVTTSLDTTQAQVTQALQDLGISNALVLTVVVGDAGSYASQQVPNSQLYYLVSFTTAPSAMVNVSKKLDAFKASPPAGFVTAQYTASLNASSAAVSAAHDATLPKLLADAQSKAGTLAAAAGLKVGGITGVSDFSSVVYGYSAPAAYITSGVLSSANTNGTSGTQFSFSATVKFAAQ
jgi:uncharacterized protein YggE